MAKFVLKNAYVTIGGTTSESGGTTITSFVQSVTINYSAAEVDKTAMGDAGVARLGGLKDWSADITLIQDFASGASLDSGIYNVIGTSMVLNVRPTTEIKGVSNPAYIGTGIIFEYSPIDGSVGDLATAPISIRGSDGKALARVTT